MRFIKALIIAAGLAQASMALQIDTSLLIGDKNEAGHPPKQHKLGKPLGPKGPNKGKPADHASIGATNLSDDSTNDTDPNSKSIPTI